MMDQLIAKFPAQLKEALEIGKNASIHPHSHQINKVYIAGMGGSAIGGNFVQDFVYDECKVPIMVGKGYRVPAYLDENTLAIFSSYSGNTEETLASLRGSQSSGAKIVCIASAGKLIEEAKNNGFDYIQVPGGWPSPRACLGYSIVQQLTVLRKLGLIGEDSLKRIKTAIDLIKYDKEDIQAKAQLVAKKLIGKTPIIYIEDRMEAVAIRLRQQINENAKMLCWHHVFPEMNHNELVGWKDLRKDITVLWLRNKDDLKRNAIRMDISKGIISELTPNIIEVYSKGISLVEKSIYFVHLGDWVSWYLSELHGVDAIEIDVIDHLKSELAKI